MRINFSLSLDAVCLVIKKTDDEEHMVRDARSRKRSVCGRGSAVSVMLHVFVSEFNI